MSIHPRKPSLKEFPAMSIYADFYVYAYLREDGSPYYIGKGRGNRAYSKKSRTFYPPNDKSRIRIFMKNMKEDVSITMEKFWIMAFGRIDNNTGILHNKTDGGEGLKNPSTETRKKMSEAKINQSVEERKKRSIAQIGKKRTDEHRKKIGDAQRGEKNHMYGKSMPFSEETRRKISNSNKGKIKSIEHREKLSLAHTGKKLSIESIRKRTETRRKNNPNYGVSK